MEIYKEVIRHRIPDAARQALRGDRSFCAGSCRSGETMPEREKRMNRQFRLFRQIPPLKPCFERGRSAIRPKVRRYARMQMRAAGNAGNTAGKHHRNRRRLSGGRQRRQNNHRYRGEI